MYPNESVFDGVGLPVLCWGAGYLDSNGVIRPGDDPMQGGGTYLKYAKITDAGQIEYKHSPIVFRDGSRRVTPLGWRPAWIFEWTIYRPVEIYQKEGDIVDSHRQLRLIVQKYIDTQCILTLYPQGNPDAGYIVTTEDFSPGFLKKALSGHDLKAEFKCVDFYKIPNDITPDEHTIEDALVPGYFNTDGTMGFGFSVFHDPVIPPSEYLVFSSFVTGSITISEQGSLSVTWQKNGTDPGEHNDVSNWEGTGRADQCWRGANSLWSVTPTPPSGDLAGGANGIVVAIKIDTMTPLDTSHWAYNFLNSYSWELSSHYDKLRVKLRFLSHGDINLYGTYSLSALTKYYFIFRHERTEEKLYLRIYDENQNLLKEESVYAYDDDLKVPTMLSHETTGWNAPSTYNTIDNWCVHGDPTAITDAQIMESMVKY